MIPIPTALPLLGWIAVSAFLMMDKNHARGFTLAALGGLLFLPVMPVVELEGLPDLDKDNVAFIGILIGTILFHPSLFRRFQLTKADLLLVVCVESLFVTAIVNDTGAYSGLSQSAGLVLHFVLPAFLARIHLGTPANLRTFLVGLALAGVLYCPFAVWEFRMSPQLHTQFYGVFQHVFAQHRRYGHWRPIVFLSHALELGRFFSFTGFLALLPMRKDLARLFGYWGNYLFVFPLLGLCLSMSWGPYLMFGALCAGYFAVRRASRITYLLPVAAFVWLAAVMAGFSPFYASVEDVARVNPGRAGSLQYRLDALEEYRPVILHRPWFGFGGFGRGRIEGRATDSQALIYLLSRGFIGACALFAWWFSMLHVAERGVHATAGTVLGTRTCGVAVLLSVCLAVSVIDKALDLHVLLLASALPTICVWVHSHQDIVDKLQAEPSL